MNQTLDGRTVLVTGANGGLGEQFVVQALERGASKVYAAARRPRAWTDDRVRPLSLDITDADAVARAVTAAPDVDLLVNNAGISPVGNSISGPEEETRRIFETNFFGTLRVANAFSPVLGANGGGTLVNVLSLAIWTGPANAYSASKAALWSATNALRGELRGQGTHVTGVVVSLIDTPMAVHWDVPKPSPATIAQRVYDGVADGALEVLTDDQTQEAKSRLSTRAEELYPWLDEQLAAVFG